MTIDAIVLSDKDNVATVLNEVEAGKTINIRSGEQVIQSTVKEQVPYGHKLALIEIPSGSKIIKYGEVIGQATLDIPAGTVAHVHNVESLRGRGDLEG